MLLFINTLSAAAAHAYISWPDIKHLGQQEGARRKAVEIGCDELVAEVPTEYVILGWVLAGAAPATATGAVGAGGPI